MMVKMKDCPLCGRWDCECEDILTPEEYERLVNEETEARR
jgi:hypothetical protein